MLQGRCVNVQFSYILWSRPKSRKYLYYGGEDLCLNIQDQHKMMAAMTPAFDMCAGEQKLVQASGQQ
jgi:hypothetical protein